MVIKADISRELISSEIYSIKIINVNTMHVLVSLFWEHITYTQLIWSVSALELNCLQKIDTH